MNARAVMIALIISLITTSALQKLGWSDFSVGYLSCAVLIGGCILLSWMDGDFEIRWLK